MLIIGITGTLGAGKGTIVKYLTEVEEFSHYSVRVFLTDKIAYRNLPLNRDSMMLVANELRTSNGPSYIIDELYLQARRSGHNCVIESIRTAGEIESLKRKGNFHLFAVDADPKIRYERITRRKSATDAVSFEVFLANEEREYTSNNPNKQNLKKCIEMADYRFNNDGSIEQLNIRVGEVLRKIKEKNERKKCW